MSLDTGDLQFLVKPFIGNGHLFGDLPLQIRNAFDDLTAIPSVIESIVLPHHSLSVQGLVTYPLPSICTVTPSPGPSKLYFSKEAPEPLGTAMISLLKTLPIPVLSRVSDILGSAGPKWLDGHQSVIYIHTSTTSRFPLWTIRLWHRILAIRTAQKAWADADRFLSALQVRNSVAVRNEADAFRLLLANLPWHGRIKGFSDNEDVTYLAAFASTKWLSDLHETFMLECLQRRMRASSDYDPKIAITNIWTSKHILTAYDNRLHNPYPPSTPNALVQLGNDLASGRKTKLGLMWYIKDGHWVSTDIFVDQSRCTVSYADPMGEPVPESVHNAANWWLAAHIKQPLVWGLLECPVQRDGYSCGILAQNALAYEFLPGVYPLIDTSTVSAAAIARLQAGAEVIRHHCLMVRPATFLIQNVLQLTKSIFIYS